MKSTQTWHVSITLADDGADVTARARLADGSVDVVGLGTVSTAVTEASGESPYELAAVRSLQSLSEALSYAADTDRYGALDQA